MHEPTRILNTSKPGDTKKFFFSPRQEENDFVSELLSAVAGDSEGFHTGGVRQQIFDEAFWLWQNTTVQPQLELSFTAWWPGKLIHLFAP